MKLICNTICAAVMIALAAGCDSAESKRFHEARARIMAGQYETGARNMRTYLERHPAGFYASRAQFFIAKARLGEGRYDEARAEYEKTIRDYPDTNEAHKARYKIALMDLVAGDVVKARDTMRVVAGEIGSLKAEARMMAEYLDDPGR